VPPFAGVAVNVTLVPEQIVVAEAETATEGVTMVLTVIVTELEVAKAGLAQDSDEVITHETTSPLVSEALV